MDSSPNYLRQILATTVEGNATVVSKVKANTENMRAKVNKVITETVTLTANTLGNTQAFNTSQFVKWGLIIQDNGGGTTNFIIESSHDGSNWTGATASQTATEHTGADGITSRGYYILTTSDGIESTGNPTLSNPGMVGKFIRVEGYDAIANTFTVHFYGIN